MKVKHVLIFIMLLTVVKSNPAQNACGYRFLPDNCDSSKIHKEANIWYFGKNAGLSFNTNPPSILTPPGINQLEGCSSIADTSGNLLFATNGVVTTNLINSDFNQLPNSNGLFAHSSASQNSIIVPQPGKDGIYYVFTIDLNIPFGHGLNFSIVNLFNRDSVTLKNKHLLPAVCEKITAVSHNNGRDVWIIVHKWDSQSFVAYLLTEDGLNQPVVSNVGTFHAKDAFNNNAIGCMKASPNGCKLALAVYGLGIVEILDFDHETGKVSNAISSQPVFAGAYGIEFSPDSKKLFLSINDYCLNTQIESKVYQFDVENGNRIFDHAIVVASDALIDYLSLQLAVDGKIYVASSIRDSLPFDGYSYIGVINNPARWKACNFNTVNHQSNDGIFLNGGKCRIGLPNFIQSYFNIPKFIYASNCFEDPTHFKMINLSNVDSVRWDFGDGSYSGDLNPFHRFPAANNYSVKLTDYYDGIGYTDSLEVVINPLPDAGINHGQDTLYLISEKPEILDAGAGFKSYSWSTGENSQKIETAEEGYYWVDVSNSGCCMKRDSILVMKVPIFIPNAFLPESSGADNTFNLIDTQHLVKDFELRIYDRWGGYITSIKEKETGWNGNGYETGVYYYSALLRLTNGREFIKTGNVTLIR